MPGAVLSMGDAALNKADESPRPHRAYGPVERRPDIYSISQRHGLEEVDSATEKNRTAKGAGEVQARA